MEDEIQGPLGFWTYPVLNTIVAISSSSESKSDTARVERDSNGNIQEITVVRDD